MFSHAVRKTYQKEPGQTRLYHPGVSVRGKVSKVLFLPATSVVFWTFPEEKHTERFLVSVI